ncbi:FUSC family protein [Verrucomicrobiota bacterium sgz303538]
MNSFSVDKQELPRPLIVGRGLEILALQPDLNRALRTSAAVLAAIISCNLAGKPTAIPFVATAAQVVCLPELRGAYHARVIFLMVITCSITIAALLGAVAAANLGAAIAGMAVIAFLGGFWRYLSSDYGPALAVNSALFYLIALAHPMTAADAVRMAEWVATGALGAGFLHIAIWLVRQQHPLRHAVSECWVAASELFTAMRPALEKEGSEVTNQVAKQQRELRSVLDRTARALTAASPKHTPEFVKHLEGMHRISGRFAMQMVAFHSSLEALATRHDFLSYAPLIDMVMSALASMARSTAVTIVMHQPENLAVTNLELRRCSNLLRLLREKLVGTGPGDPTVTQILTLLDKIAAQLDEIRQELTETVDRSVHRVVAPLKIADLRVRSIRASAAWINPASSMDPTLVRYSLRMAVLTMLAVALYKYFEIPRGYWIALTIVVVLQPDYGSTRQRAAHRVLGTLVGTIVASALLWVPLPVWLLAFFTAVMVFGFAYFLRRNYGIAVFFVTVMLVLLTESMMPVHLDFTIGRLLSSLVGGSVALAAAFILWPSWERRNLPSLISAALRATRTYLETVGRRLRDGKAYGEDAIPARQRAERAENMAATSLQRMLAEPREQQYDSARVVALVRCNQRVIFAITVLAADLQEGRGVSDTHIVETFDCLCSALERMATAMEHEADSACCWEEVRSDLEKLWTELRSEPPVHVGKDPDEVWRRMIFIQIQKITAEIRTMALVMAPEEEVVC